MENWTPPSQKKNLLAGRNTPPKEKPAEPKKDPQGAEPGEKGAADQKKTGINQGDNAGQDRGPSAN